VSASAPVNGNVTSTCAVPGFELQVRLQTPNLSIEATALIADARRIVRISATAPSRVTPRKDG
jgi:hypothetical protein